MVDRVVSCEGKHAQTVFAICEGNMLLEDNALSSAGIIENMAQSCAARMGCKDWQRGEPIKIGYIGDVRDCDILRHPVVGETLETQVNIIEEMFGLMLAEVTVKSGETIVATARMKIAMTDIIAQLDE